MSGGSEECYRELRAFPAFKEISDDRIHWMCDHVETLEYDQGAVVVKEGETPQGFYILVDGHIIVTKRTGAEDIPAGRQDAPNFFGEVQLFSEEKIPVTLTTTTPCKLYLMKMDDFRELMLSSRPFEKSIFKAIAERSRGLESFIRGREKMASLGTLSAGLAHELNNPAASLARTMEKIMPLIRQLEIWNLEYGRAYLDDEHTEKWLKLRERAFENITQQVVDSRTAQKREDAFYEWLEEYGVPEPWKWAPSLAISGVDIEEITELQDVWKDHPEEPMRHQGIRWLALSCEVYSMIYDGQNASKRISTLVGAIKSYSYMDKDARQRVDVHRGIEDTLLILKNKWKYGIEIVREYDDSLPEIEVYGSELNQVWTNILDNAIDAMDGKGTITLRTYKEDRFLCVDLEDTGPGIPKEVQSRIFEPFFTTKEPGKGTGLGLEICRRIIENRHRGSICVQSEPGKTCFHIALPIN